jgi:hypothetical protein
MKLKVLRKLIALKNCKQYKSLGICYYAGTGTDVRYIGLLEQYFVKWPKFSGSVGYPVPDPSGRELPGNKFYQAINTEKMWTGEYGDLRRELLDCLIVEITKDLNWFDRLRLWWCYE